MNLILRSSGQALMSLTDEERVGIANALNEICNGIHIDEPEFQTRLGVDRALLVELLHKFQAEPSIAASAYERVDVSAAPASVMVRAVSVYGDPVEMGTSEAEALVRELQKCIFAAA
jgi:hypothetical protein